MIRTILAGLVLAVCSVAHAQPAYFTTYKATVNPSSEAITLQRPTTSTRKIIPLRAWLHASAAATITLEVRGTAATTTALTIVPLSGVSTMAQAFSASNVGAGSVVGTYELIAGGEGITVDLTGIRLAGNASTENMTFKPSNITGTVKVLIWWLEEH